MKIIDTHAHIVCDKLFLDVDNIIQNALSKGVIKILCICTNKTEVERALTLQQRYDFIDIAYGVHPADLHIATEDDFILLEQLLKENKIIAVGEIGLDYHWNVVSKSQQIDSFVRQISLANKYHRPVLIHMRDATKDCVDTILAHCKTKGIMHCFSGSLETAKILVDFGFYISFGGILTFKNANNLLEVAKSLPKDKIFVETDCPYLAPVPYRGKVNEVAFIHATFAFLEKLRNESLSDQLIENYEKLFYGKN